jgi:hypothetical protein
MVLVANSQTAKLIQKRCLNTKFNFLQHQADRDSDVQYKYRYLSNGAIHMNSKYRARKLRATSVDSKLTPSEQFKRLINLEPPENVNFINWQRHIYQIELNYPSTGLGSYVHFHMTYCVIARQSGCSTVIKVKNVVKINSKLRRPIKIKKHFKRQSIKWIPRFKTRR